MSRAEGARARPPRAALALPSARAHARAPPRARRPGARGPDTVGESCSREHGNYSREQLNFSFVTRQVVNETNYSREQNEWRAVVWPPMIT